MDLVILEQMIPEDHLLRRIDRAVDFGFIHELCVPLYCADNGRPAIDPEILLRMLFIGYLYGIKSEARLEEEVYYNMAYKWFCGLELTEKAPNATTISQNRRRRFRDNGHCGEGIQRNPAAVHRKGTSGRSDSVHGFHAHQGEGEQAQEAIGEGGGSSEGLHEGAGRAGRS